MSGPSVAERQPSVAAMSRRLLHRGGDDAWRVVDRHPSGAAYLGTLFNTSHRVHCLANELGLIFKADSGSFPVTYSIPPSILPALPRISDGVTFAALLKDCEVYWEKVRILLYYYFFFSCLCLPLSLSISVCVHSLTPHGTSLTIIPLSINDTILTFYLYRHIRRKRTWCDRTLLKSAET